MSRPATLPTLDVSNDDRKKAQHNLEKAFRAFERGMLKNSGSSPTPHSTRTDDLAEFPSVKSSTHVTLSSLNDPSTQGDSDNFLVDSQYASSVSSVPFLPNALLLSSSSKMAHVTTPLLTTSRSSKTTVPQIKQANATRLQEEHHPTNKHTANKRTRPCPLKLTSLLAEESPLNWAIKADVTNNSIPMEDTRWCNKIRPRYNTKVADPVLSRHHSLTKDKKQFLTKQELAPSTPTRRTPLTRSSSVLAGHRGQNQA
jgi:hypothetical protein